MSSASTQPVVSSNTPNEPLADPKSGRLSFRWLKWFDNIARVVNTAFDAQGALQGRIGARATLVNRTVPLASVVGGLSNTGTLDTGSLTSKAAVVGNLLTYTAEGWMPEQAPQAPVSAPAVPHEWLNSYNSVNGDFTQSQPSFTDVGGQATAAQVPLLSALNGSVTGLQLPLPTTSLIGGVEAVNPVASEWVDSINTSGVPHLSQPAFSNLSGSATPAQLPAATGAAEGILQLAGDLGGTALSPQVVGVTNALLKASAYLNTATNYVANTVAVVPIDTVIFDPAGIFTSSNHRITPTKAGYYLCIANVVSASANSTLIACILKNGSTTPIAIYGTELATSATGVIATAMGILQLNGTTDYVQLAVANQTAATVAAALQAQFNLLTILGPF